MDILKQLYANGLADVVGLEIRVDRSVLRNALGGQMSVKSFNRLAHCLGSTTDNKLVYSLLFLYGDRDSSFLVWSKSKVKSFPKNSIFTINHFGTQRYWQREWIEILNDLKCKKLIDLFGGSGFIGLLGKKLSIFNEITINELDPMLYNYHRVMTSGADFEKLIHLLSFLPTPTKQSYTMVRNYVAGESGKRFQTVNYKKAAYLFYLNHYSIMGIGGLDKKKKHLKNYLGDLRKTHELYDGIKLTNWHYGKLLEKCDEDTLLVVDPPFCPSVRVDNTYYNKEFTEPQHKALLEKLSKLNCKIVLCGFEGSYTLGDDWECYKMRRLSRTGRQECLWIRR